MRPYYPIPYSINDTWIAIQTWACLIVVYCGRESTTDSVFPLTRVGMVAWLDGKLEVLEGDEAALPLDALRTIFEKLRYDSIHPNY